MKPRVSDIVDRWRHTHGYGVHSPLAFRLIRECVHPDDNYAYYADSRIDWIFADDKHMRFCLRMLIRLVNELGISDMWMPDCPRKVRDALVEAFPKLRISTGSGCPENVGFIVVFTCEDPAACWMRLPAAGNVGMLVCRRCGVPDMEESTLTLAGRHFTLYLRREGMRRVTYSVL